MDTEALQQQLAALECRFRRLQYAVGLLVIALSASALMAQTASNRVVTANEFVLQDAAGVNRATLAVEGGAAKLALFDDQKRVRARLGEGFPGGNGSPSDEGGQLELFGGGDRTAWLDTGTHGSHLIFYRATDTTGRSMTSEMNLSGEFMEGTTRIEPLIALGSPSTRRSILIDTSAPRIGVADADGFEAQLGASDLVTVKTDTASKTSAASLVLFGKDKNVLWSTPR